jgi:hypothetical protein
MRLREEVRRWIAIDIPPLIRRQQCTLIIVLVHSKVIILVALRILVKAGPHWNLITILLEALPNTRASLYDFLQ